MDIFDDEVEDEWRAHALWTISQCPDIDFLLVTKRPKLFRSWAERAARWVRNEKPTYDNKLEAFITDWLCGKPPVNVWMITSLENQKVEKRIEELIRIPAFVRGLSCEPLLGPINLGLMGTLPKDVRSDYTLTHQVIHWVIAGGESGAGARMCNVEWIADLRDQCSATGTAFFCKQLGSDVRHNTEGVSVLDKKKIRILNAPLPKPLKDKKGGDLNEWEPSLRVRQWPESMPRQAQPRQQALFSR